MVKTRLNKYIASAGICSRRDADELISQGLVSVNGKKVTELGLGIDPKDKVVVKGELIRPKKHEYYRFYKPSGYITTSDDEKSRKTIYDILPAEFKNLNPVGRLDRASTGLLILTNDGELINELTHPSVHIPKTYLVTVDKKVKPDDLKKMSDGLEIEKGKMAYAEATILESSNSKTLMQITLYQGLNRQIRKMFELLGYEVKSLKRIQHANITLDGLKKGQFKPLKPRQVKELRAYLAKAARNA